LGLGSNGQQGIYDMTGGTLLKVVDLSDIVDNRPVASLHFSTSGLSGALAFEAMFVDGSQGLYTWSRPGLAGDFNSDGKVDAADYVAWRNGLGTTYTQNDYDGWRAHFGQTAGSGSGARSFNGSVPEPCSLNLFFASAIVGLVSQTRSLARMNCGSVPPHRRHRLPRLNPYLRMTS